MGKGKPVIKLSNLAASLLAAIPAGMIASFMVLDIAFTENSQGEFYDTITGRIDFIYSLQLGLLAFVPVAMGVFLVTLFLLSLFRSPVSMDPSN